MRPENHRARELLTVKEVALMLKLAPKTIRRWARLGRLPAMRLGSEIIRFDPAKIERWLRAQEGGWC